MTSKTQVIAELDQAVDEALEESFPASDPPSSHQPDVPPGNAADKWRAAAPTKPDDPPSEGGEDESSGAELAAGR